MDINYYLAREQVERVRAEGASCDGARNAHAGLADSYRRLIDHHRNTAARRFVEAAC